MVDVDPSWINASAGAPAYAANELRRNEAVLLYGGVADRLGAREGVRPGSQAVSLAGTTITVHNIACVIYPALTNTSGPYRAALLETTFEHDPPDGTNPRKDIVVAEVKDDDEDVSGLRLARPNYVAGVPGVSPSEPSVPTGAFKLATIDVPASGGGAATLTYDAPLTVANGGVLPVRDSGDLPTAGLYSGMVVYNQATDELLVRSGTAWVTVARTSSTHARYIAVNSQTIADKAWDRVHTGTAVSECPHITMLDSERWQVETDGVYAVEGSMRFAGLAEDGSRHQVLSDDVSEAQRYSGNSAHAATGTHTVGSGFTRYFNAGDIISQWLWQNNSGTTLNTSPAGESNHISFTLLAES